MYDVPETVFAPGILQFRLFGKWFAYSLADWNQALGLVSEDDVNSTAFQTSMFDFPGIDYFDEHEVYEQLTGQCEVIFKQKGTKASLIVDPV